MTGGELIRPTSAKAWDLRTAWATGARIALTLEHCDFDRVEGIVSRVAATDATTRVGGLVIPLDRILAVHSPSRLGDSTAGKAWAGAGRRKVPQVEELPL